MAGVRYNFDDKTRNHVKNLKVSANILKADIRKLNEQLATTQDPAAIEAIQKKIAYKENRINEKLSEVAQLQEAAGTVPITYTKKKATQEATTPAVIEEPISPVEE